MAAQATEQEKAPVPLPPPYGKIGGDTGLPTVDEETRRALTAASPSIDWKTLKIKAPGLVEVHDGKLTIEIANRNAALQAECKEIESGPSPNNHAACAFPRMTRQFIVVPTVGLLRQYLEHDQLSEMILRASPKSDLPILDNTNPEQVKQLHDDLAAYITELRGAFAQGLLKVYR